MARRSTISSASSRGAPCTWQRNPISAYLSARTMPDLASRRLANTSCVELPMDETIPIPVTTTRLMPASCLPPATMSRKRTRRGPFGPQRLGHTWAATRNPASPRRAAPERQFERRASSRGRLHLVVDAEQADPQIGCAIDDVAVGGEPAISDAEHKPRSHHALDVDAVHHLLDVGQHLAGEFQFSKPERAALSRGAEPAE